MKSIREFIIGIVKQIYLFVCKDYKVLHEESKNKMLVSYLSEPFRKRNDINYMSKHQNRGETLIMAKVLDSLKISYTFTRLDKPHFSFSGYDIIFGVEPNFVKASLSNPNAIKIYYATGAYCKHQNEVIMRRTDEFNLKNGTQVPYIRLVQEHEANEISDYIIQIGSKYTLQSYPKELVNKITIIRQSCHNFKFENFLEKKIKSFSKTDFIWMGSAGSILKGFDLVVEYFFEHTEYQLHVLGTIDSDVYDFYKDKLSKFKNIHIYGFVNLDSNTMEEIALKASYVIMPSASEGCPGSVINMMKLGCIPIVTSYSAFDGIENLGYFIDGYSMQDIDNAITKALNDNSISISERIKNCYEFANCNFNQEVFEEDFKKSILNIIK